MASFGGRYAAVKTDPRIGKKRASHSPFRLMLRFHPSNPPWKYVFCETEPRVRSTSTLAIDRFARQPHATASHSLSLTLVLDKKKKKTGKTLEIDRFGRRREGNDRDDAQKQTPQTHRRHWQTWSLVGWRTGRGPSPPWFRGEERALRLAHNRELIPRVSDRRSIRSKVSLVFLISRTSSLCFFSLCFSLSREN